MTVRAPSFYIDSLKGYVQETQAIAKQNRHGYRETKNDPACSVMGICKACKMVGTLSFPANLKGVLPLVNKIMAGKSVPNIFCLKCKAVTEFIPYGMRKSGVDLIERTQRDMLTHGFEGA